MKLTFLTLSEVLFNDSVINTPTNDGIVVKYKIYDPCLVAIISLLVEEVTCEGVTPVYSTSLPAGSSNHTIPRNVLTNCGYYQVKIVVSHPVNNGVITQQSGKVQAHGKICDVILKINLKWY